MSKKQKKNTLKYQSSKKTELQIRDSELGES